MLKFLVASLLLTFAFASESSSSESTATTTSSGESSSSSESSSSTTTTKSSVAQLHNDLTCNYYYTSFDSSHFAFALDQCTLYTLQGLYMSATCLNSTTLQVKRYGSSSCSGTPTSTSVYSHNKATFYCGGVSGYANLSITVTGCPATYVVYAAINTCTNASSNVWSSVYCYGSKGEIQYYSASTCSDASFSSLHNFNQTCAYLFTTHVGSIAVDGQLNSCYFKGTTTTSSPTTTSSNANIYYINTIVFCVVMMFASLLL